MCQFKYTRHSCGHTLPKLEKNDDPSCKLCVPVLVALKYYHDQVTQICVENALEQPPVRIPKPCRPIGPDTLGDTEETARNHARDQARFERIMDQLGVNSAERSSVERLASQPNQTSKRDTNGHLYPVCPPKLHFMKELEIWQHRQFQPANITFNTVSWGCGGTGPGVQGDCLVGWTGQGILMHRHGIWNVNPPHPSHAWSPLPVGYLYIDYGEAPVLQLPKQSRAKATRTSIDIPMYKCLYAVLCGRPSGPLVYNDEGHLVPALGASGPEVPVYPHLPPPPPISSGLPLPQLPMSSVHKEQLRPPQVFVPPARLRQGPGHRYSATWNSPVSINQGAGGSRPNQSQKQRTHKNHKERYGKLQSEAGPSQPVDRAEINTKIKELPQRRASKSGNATPTSTTSAAVSQRVYSRHPTPGNTRPATPAGNVSQSDENTIGLGIIHESTTAPSVEATNEDVEDTVTYQPPHHRIPHSQETKASTSTSEGKKPIRPIPSRQTSLHPTTNLPPPPEETIFDLSSNMLIGAEQPQIQPTTQSQEISALQASSQTEQHSTHPKRPDLIQNITQSTCHMTQYVNAQQQVPGVTYTLNPTAEAFEPDRKSEEGDGKGKGGE